MYRDKVVILNYHHICRTVKDEGPASISADKFKEHLKYLWQGGFNVISLDTLRFFMEGKVQLPENALCITFDDGYQSYSEFAVPALKKYSWPSACFVVVKDAGGVEAGRLPHMNWETMGKLKDTGLVTFGSHTFDSHGLLPGSTPSKPISELANPMGLGTPSEESVSEYTARVTRDLRKSQRLLEAEFKTPTHYLAYPYGVYGDRLKDIATSLGFDLMFTTDSRAVTKKDAKWAIPRLNAGSSWVDVDYLKKRIADVTR